MVHYVHTDSAPPSVLNYDAVKELGLVGASVTPSGFPQITGLSAATNGGMASNIGPTNAGTYYNDKPTVVGSVTWIHGNHSYRAGGEWAKDIWTSVSSGGTYGNYGFSANQTGQPYLNTTTISGNSIGFPYASFLLGAANSGSVSNFQDGQWRKHNFGFYVQDTWKVSRKLTLDYGIRWDYQTAYKELYSRNSEFAPLTPNPSAGGLLGATQYEGYGAKRCNCDFTNTYPYAIGPRIGVAYQVAPKTVLRAGWGFVYGTTAVVNYQLGGALGTGFNTLSFTNPAFGQPALAFQNGLHYNTADLYAATLDPGIRPSAGQINSPPAYEDPSGGRPARINQWNISLQREIGKDLMVEAAYVGNRAVWLQADSLVDFNVVSQQRLASFGLDVNSAANRALLILPLSSPQVIAAGFKAPYAGFPTSSTLAQALRPYPQFGNLGGRWVARGNSWYDSLQGKVTKRYSHGLTATVAYTWQKELNLGAGAWAPTSPAHPPTIFSIGPTTKYIAAESQPLQLAFGFDYRMPAFASNTLGARHPARLDRRRLLPLYQRPAHSVAGGAEQSEHAAVPRHLCQPRARPAALHQGSQLPLHRSQQGFHPESGGVDRSGCRAVRDCGGLLYRLSFRAAARGKRELRETVPYSRRHVVRNARGVLQHLQPHSVQQPGFDQRGRPAGQKRGRRTHFRFRPGESRVGLFSTPRSGQIVGRFQF